jgi:hypothetical protein
MNDFDVRALYDALDAQRRERGLSWQRVAAQMWEQSAVLNARRHDHPISPATITGIAKRGDLTCQHALFFLRWLGRTPESFISGTPVHARDEELPVVGPDQRLRWDLSALYAALNERRGQHELTWRAVAAQLRCSEHQLTGIKTARYAIGMKLAMRIVQWLERPASAFVYAAKW